MKTRGHLIAALLLAACSSDPGTAPDSDEPEATVGDSRPLPVQAPSRAAHDTDNSGAPVAYPYGEDPATGYQSGCAWIESADVGDCDCANTSRAACFDSSSRGQDGVCRVHAFCIDGGLLVSEVPKLQPFVGQRGYVCVDGHCSRVP